MSNFVRILNGSYRNNEITNKVLPLVKPLTPGKKGLYVTVRNLGLFQNAPDKIRVRVNSSDQVVDSSKEFCDFDVVDHDVQSEPEVVETDEQAMDRIRERFEILDVMTNAIATGQIRGMILSGPPGVGKSFGVGQVLDNAHMIAKMTNKKSRSEFVKGSMTPIGLYQTLFHNSGAGDILVFDDCDSILFDEVCLNMLKAVLDSGERRRVAWKSESAALRREGIPDEFDFKGGVIFITNLNFESVRSQKIKDHLEALMSRCHYLDLTMDSMRDKFLRIRQIVEDGMLKSYNFGEQGDKEVIDFMVEHQVRLREISLRMVLKISDLRKMDEGNWKRLAETTCMKRIGHGN